MDCTELFCMEIEEGQEQQAIAADQVLLKDDRVIERLLNSEDRCLPSHCSPFTFQQKDVKPYMLKMVLSWMLEVGEEERCDENVFPLASNYMCRILAVMQLSKSQLQLLGAACLFIASKLKESQPLSAEKLVIYTDYSVTLNEILDMEMVVLFRLKWDLSAITPNDFIDQILVRLLVIIQLPSYNDHHHHLNQLQRIKRFTQTFVALCSTEFKFATIAPSMICAVCIALAIKQIYSSSSSGSDHHHQQQQQRIFDGLHSITGCEIDCLKHHMEQIESELARFLRGNEQRNCHNNNVQDDEKTKADGPSTPTDVRDIVYY